MIATAANVDYVHAQIDQLMDELRDSTYRFQWSKRNTIEQARKELTARTNQIIDNMPAPPGAIAMIPWWRWADLFLALLSLIPGWGVLFQALKFLLDKLHPETKMMWAGRQHFEANPA